jgi:hypothetical protein
LYWDHLCSERPWPIWFADLSRQLCLVATIACPWCASSGLHQVSQKAASWLDCSLYATPDNWYHHRKEKLLCDASKVHPTFQHWLHTTLIQRATRRMHFCVRLLLCITNPWST